MQRSLVSTKPELCKIIGVCAVKSFGKMAGLNGVRVDIILKEEVEMPEAFSDFPYFLDKLSTMCALEIYILTNKSFMQISDTERSEDLG